MMLKYAHIGYPKAASTWLQIFLFPRHPEIRHFGRHNGDDIVDDDLRLALWNDLIAQPSLLYDQRETAATFDRLFAQAAASGAAACGISQEVLTFSMIGSVDLPERARRLQGAMGRDTRIVIITRNQFDWIRSVFCGLLKEGGMPLDLNQFLFYFYYQQSQSPLYTLFYDEIYRTYADLFGPENVFVVPFELIKNRPQEFADQVCRAMGVAPLPGLPLQSVNPSPSGQALSNCLQYNRQHQFYFGSNWLHRPFAMAAEPVFRKRFSVEAPSWSIEERARSVFIMEHAEDLARKAREEGKVIPEMDTRLPQNYRDLLASVYAPHNVKLMEYTGIDVAALGYPA